MAHITGANQNNSKLIQQGDGMARTPGAYPKAHTNRWRISSGAYHPRPELTQLRSQASSYITEYSLGIPHRCIPKRPAHTRNSLGATRWASGTGAHRLAHICVAHTRRWRIPPGAYPNRAYPWRIRPHWRIPTGAYQPGAYPSGAYHPRPELTQLRSQA